MKNELVPTGRVYSLSLNGEGIPKIKFNLDGPVGDVHSGFSRLLSGHDGAYMQTSALKKGCKVFNWRTWTGLSLEEIIKVEWSLGLEIPQGCLLENIVFDGIDNFSQLPPTSRLVFPQKPDGSQLILAVWEENGPCRGVGERLQRYHKKEGVSKKFITSAQGKRGVVGIVLSEGLAEIGDIVQVYLPTE